ncbi:hypothetical protein Y032_0140g2155 [Ancylostoma ceylanicum]|uniref:Uncharacterized protein n=1 Tax=Ancylostoma ceylanicum TaxID=53326 RepID=A0A016T462_9BILA|nr:hypothetical protein Y032_0140g2155 [Ancylostoma ceylanicum]
MYSDMKYSHGHSDSVLFNIARITTPPPITSASWWKSVSVALVLDKSFIPLVNGAISGRQQLFSLRNETIRGAYCYAPAIAELALVMRDDISDVVAKKQH